MCVHVRMCTYVHNGSTHSSYKTNVQTDTKTVLRSFNTDTQCFHVGLSTYIITFLKLHLERTFLLAF